MSHKFNVAAGVFCLMMVFSLVFVYEGRVERVTFSKVKDYLKLEKIRPLTCHRKQAKVSLGRIKRVHAAMRGSVGLNNDGSYFAIVVTLDTGVQLKLLETKNMYRAKKQVSDAVDILAAFDPAVLENARRSQNLSRNLQKDIPESQLIRRLINLNVQSLCYLVACPQEGNQVHQRSKRQTA